MVQLMSLNVEGVNHHDRVLTFIDRHTPTVICLQEVTEALLVKLRHRGYLTAFMPMCEKPFGVIGVAIAARHPFKATTQYYHQVGTVVPAYNSTDKEHTIWFGYLTGTIVIAGESHTIITTHFWDSGDGHTDAMQKKLMRSLLEKLHQEPVHILCGDFNIPRHHNELYPTLTEHYTDNIPRSYTSSLDRNLHRLGTAKLDQPIFDAYMVDYIFTKPPYRATKTQLHFGVSDHAAVVSEITIQR